MFIGDLGTAELIGSCIALILYAQTVSDMESVSPNVSKTVYRAKKGPSVIEKSPIDGSGTNSLNLA